MTCRGSLTGRQRKYCSVECKRLHTTEARTAGKSASRNAVSKEPRFIGVDGEGVTREDGTHNYIMLSIGEDTIESADDDTPLQYWEIFRFLYAHFMADRKANPHNPGIYVGFALGYDYAQWFRTLPEERARMLLTPEGIAKRKPRNPNIPYPWPVEYRGWEFDIMGGRFKLRPEGTATNGKAFPWLWVCDAFPFFQTSFLNAIGKPTDEHAIVSVDEYDALQAGKANRATAHRSPDMLKYNAIENRVMARLMARLHTGFEHMGIKLKRTQWFGPGQSAGAWLKNVNAPTHDDIEAAIRKEVLTAARASYYGGWFEIMAHGHIPGKVYEYDINSAYPKIISQLPCLLHGVWTQDDNGERNPSRSLALVYATMYGNPRKDIGVHSHRTRQGNILRPKISVGWIWQHELKANIQAGFILSADVHTTWSYRYCDCAPPFAAMERLYHERLRTGKNTPQGVACKLVYNSAYGKMAQSIGKPLHANPIYASLITAGCRTQIISAIATHPRPESVVMVATDGVYFTEPHPLLEIDPERLGAWDVSVKDNLTLLMPGVYWDDKTREYGASKAKSRGVPRAALSDVIATMDQAFNVFDVDTEWPSMEIPLGFTMLTPRQALAQRKWELAGTVSHDGTKTLSASPRSKRDASSRYRSEGIIRTRPYDMPSDSEQTSHAYDKTFGFDLESEPVDLDGHVWTMGIHEDMNNG